MQIDITKSPVDNVLALLNDINPSVKLTSANVTLEVPIVRIPDADVHNTSLTINGVEAEGYSGTIVMTYNRLPLAQAIASAPITFKVSNVTTLASLLQDILTEYKLLGGVSLVGDLVRPHDGTNTSTIVLAADADSLLYIGELPLTLDWITLDLGVVVTHLDGMGFDPAVVSPDLANVIVKTQLSGFDSAI